MSDEEQTQKRAEMRERNDRREADERAWRFAYHSRDIVAQLQDYLEFSSQMHKRVVTAEDVAADLGYPAERGAAWLSGTHDFTMSELLKLEQRTHYKLIATPAHHSQAFPSTEEELREYDDNVVKQRLDEARADATKAGLWCGACGWLGQYDERKKQRGFRESAECPNCGRIHTMQDIGD